MRATLKHCLCLMALLLALMPTASFAQTDETAMDETFDDGASVDGEAVIIPAIEDGYYSQEFRRATEAHAIEVLQWQLRTSERILILVMVLTTAGVLLAAYQLFHALHWRKPGEAGTDTGSKLAFGGGKFEAQSSIVGLMILAISLGALYLFLNFVYKVEIIVF